MPLVSVIVPTYNRPLSLEKTLISILNQTFSDIEIIVVNDAGEDVSNVIRILDDDRISYIENEKNKGLAGTRNVGILKARGKYVSFLDDDDLFYPTHIEILVNEMEDKPQMAGVYSDVNMCYMRDDGVILQEQVIYSLDWKKNYFYGVNFLNVLSYMLKKEVIIDIGLFDESLRALEDYDMLIRLSKKYYLKHVPVITCKYIRQNKTMGALNATCFVDRRKPFFDKNKLFFESAGDINKYRTEFFNDTYSYKMKTYADRFKDKKIVVFGAGEGGRRLFGFLKEKNIPVSFLIDSQGEKSKNDWTDKYIYTPDQFFESFYDKDCFIFVAVGMIVHIFEVLEYLYNKNCKDFLLMY